MWLVWNLHWKGNHSRVHSVQKEGSQTNRFRLGGWVRGRRGLKWNQTLWTEEKKLPTAVSAIHLLRPGWDANAVWWGLVKLLRTAVLINQSTGDCGWQHSGAATNLQNIYPKQDSCLNIPLFPLQSAFVSLFLAFLALEICFLEMVEHLWLTYCQTYCFPVFLQPKLEECRYVGKSIFSKPFRKTRWKLIGLEIYGGGGRSEIGEEF